LGVPALRRFPWRSKVSTLDVVAEVLREVAPRALKARELVELAGNRLPTASRTPTTVVSRDLAIDIKGRGATSRFLRVDRGEFLLKEALPTALYNDTDAYAASWTRNLIAAGEIAEGVVDERSIRDLKPSDVASYRQFHAFSGIGVWSRALRDAGWPDDVNVWSGSAPCQSFSQAGRKRGFDDERHLWPEWFRLISACRPAWIFGEQVSSKDGLAWLDLVFADLEGANYTVRALDLPAAGVGAPHRRQRLYFVAYARERGREVFGASWVHARRQPGNNAYGRGTVDGGVACTENSRCHDGWPPLAHGGPELDSEGGIEIGCGSFRTGPRRRAVFRPKNPPRGRSKRATPIEIAGHDPGESREWGHAHGSRPQGGISWTRGGTGPASTGEAGDPSDGGLSRELGHACLDRVGEHPRELSCDEAQHEERPAPGDHASVSASPTYRPGDRLCIDGDPGWGGAVAGFWAVEVEWVYCRPTPGNEDGCFRPTKSGTLLLVDGVASSLGRSRARRLKGFGNAIVLPLATVFVEAVLDALVETEANSNAGAAGSEAVAQDTFFGSGSPHPSIEASGEEDPEAVLLGKEHSA